MFHCETSRPRPKSNTPVFLLHSRSEGISEKHGTHFRHATPPPTTSRGCELSVTFSSQVIVGMFLAVFGAVLAQAIVGIKAFSRMITNLELMKVELTGIKDDMSRAAADLKEEQDRRHFVLDQANAVIGMVQIEIGKLQARMDGLERSK